MTPAFPRPREMKQPRRPPVIVYPDGREVCDLSTTLGKRAYICRVALMLQRQGGKCGLQLAPQCRAYPWIDLAHATFEHQDGRGMDGAHRDDRIEKDGKPYNLAACGLCNGLKASRRLHPKGDRYGN